MIFFDMILLLTLTTFLSNPTLAKMPEVHFDFQTLKVDELAVFQDGKYEAIKMVEFEGVKYSQNCFKNGKVPTCEAFLVTKKPESKILAKFEGHPAAQQCVKMGGANLIALDKQKLEYNICYFKDKSYGISWSLYYKLNKKSVIN